ncbi:hypothetical protein RRG08_040368 [Elysia crispata]|uniref:Uncharacterized protein n=1 Tax=Elysia crispata TaxID=231223 RepID=A0AAE1A1T9_9GAST|nr:hypothetical protein RRG08_040368 [Elysia crispata]
MFLFPGRCALNSEESLHRVRLHPGKFRNQIWNLYGEGLLVNLHYWLSLWSDGSNKLEIWQNENEPFPPLGRLGETRRKAAEAKSQVNPMKPQVYHN